MSQRWAIHIYHPRPPISDPYLGLARQLSGQITDDRLPLLHKLRLQLDLRPCQRLRYRAVLLCRLCVLL